MMKLQLALDVFSLEDALKLTKKVKNYVDIIEIGTPFVIESGMEAVRRFREAFPDKEILADTKIMDAGELEASSAFDAGADYVTVLGVTDLATMKACVDISKRYGKFVVADMICVPNLPERIGQLEELGVQGIAVHTGVDQQKRGRTPLDDLRVMKKYAKKAEISVAGGIRYDTIPVYAELKPDVLIVGGAIGSAKDPAAEAKRIYEEIQKYNK
ncbi:MAG: 3-hexulose-6-phosphate synthase [Eubacteriales bacterium]|jgi:3-hexulose-6-phosphate synthase